jgi:hypothetical protein
MANAVTAVYQKQGINFKSTVFNIALSGNYAAPEVVTLITVEVDHDLQGLDG